MAGETRFAIAYQLDGPPRFAGPVLRICAAEIFRLVDASGPLIFGDLWIWAEWPRPIDFSTSAVRRDDLLRCFTFFYPLFEGADGVERVRAFAPGAVSHSGSQ